MNAAELCPSQWKVPSKNDWEELTSYLSSEGLDGNALKAGRWFYQSSYSEQEIANSTGFSPAWRGQNGILWSMAIYLHFNVV